MSYTVSEIEELLTTEVSEMEVILDSDREYDLHLHDTQFHEDSGEIETRGMLDGDFYHVVFPADAIEHYRYHEEL